MKINYASKLVKDIMTLRGKNKQIIKGYEDGRENRKKN